MPVVTRYYGLDHKETPSFVVGFYNAYVGERTRLMRAEYARRIAALDPIRRMELQNDWLRTMAGVERQRLAVEQARITGDKSIVKQYLASLGTIIARDVGATATVQAAGIAARASTFRTTADLETAREKSRILDDDVLAQADAAAQDYVDKVNEALQTAGSEEEARDRLDAITADHQTEVAQRAGELTPVQAQEFARRVYSTTRPALEVLTGDAESAAAFGRNLYGASLEAPDVLTPEEIERQSPKYGGGVPSGASAFLGAIPPEARAAIEAGMNDDGGGGYRYGYSVAGTPGSVPLPPPMPGGVAPAASTPGAAPSTPPTGSLGGVAPTTAPAGGDIYGPLAPYASRIEMEGPGSAFGVGNQDDGTRLPWDYYYRSWFGQQPSEAERSLAARLIAFKAADPAGFEAMLDARAKVHQREATREGRPVERGVTRAYRGLDLDRGAAGKPSTQRGVDLRNYGPGGLYETKEEARKGALRSALFYGYDGTQMAGLLRDFNAAWGDQTTAAPLPADERAAAEAAVENEDLVYAQRVADDAAADVGMIAGTGSYREAEATRRAAETAEQARAAEAALLPEAGVERPVRASTVPRDSDAAEPVAPPPPPITIPPAAPLSEQARDVMPLAYREKLAAEWEGMSAEEREAAARALAVEVPKPPEPPARDPDPQPVESPALDEAEADFFRRLEGREKGDDEPPPPPKEPPKPESDLARYAERLSAAEGGRELETTYEPEAGSLDAPDAETQDEAQVDSVSTLAKTPRKKKKRSKDDKDGAAEAETDEGDEEPAE